MGSLRAAGYVAVNVKIHAMKAKLLSLADYDRIIQTGSLMEGVRTIIGLVKPSNVAEELSNLLVKGEELDLSEIDRSLTRSFIAIHNQLAEMCPEDSRNILGLYYLKKYDFENLKTIIKAIHRGITPEKIQELLMPPIFGDFEELDELMALESIDQLKDTLRDELAKKAVNEAFEAYEETNNTLVLELALDRELYTQLWDMISTLPKGDRIWAFRLLGLRIDLLNILAILRGVQQGLDLPTLNQFLIPVTYQLKKNLERAMESKTMVEALRFLSVGPYEEIINRIRTIIEEKRSLADAEHLVEGYITKEASRVFFYYPFHIGTVLGFLNLISIELRNIKAVLIGKVEGVSADKIRETLIFVQ